MPIDHKKREREPTKKHRIRPGTVGQPLGRFDLYLGCPWLVHRKKPKNIAPIPNWHAPAPLRISIEMRRNYQNDSGTLNGNGGSRAQLQHYSAGKSMATVAIYHGIAYIGQACASTISQATIRYALMGHCVHGVTLYRLMACCSYGHFIHLRASLREL